MAPTPDLFEHAKSKERTPIGAALFGSLVRMSTVDGALRRDDGAERDLPPCGRRHATKGILMTGLYQHSLLSRILLLGLVFVMGGSVAAIAKDDPVRIPKNAKAKSYGSGWECVRGFRQSKSDCVRIKIPPNAYPTRSSYGAGWECRRGFKSKDDGCVAIPVPVNGYLASYGDQWKCHRGYQQVDEKCLSIVVPKNAYLTDDSYGRGWTCKRGFVVKKKECIAVAVPANAHLDFTGTSWECDRPYREKLGSCVEP